VNFCFTLKGVAKSLELIYNNFTDTPSPVQINKCPLPPVSYGFLWFPIRYYGFRMADTCMHADSRLPSLALYKMIII
jgi:hypothetical protein